MRRLKNTLIYLLARLVLGLARCLPWRLALAFGENLGRLGYRLAGRARRDTLAHLALAFPDAAFSERRRLARAVFRHFGRAAAEWACVRDLPDVTAFVRIDPESLALLRALLGRGRGVIFVTAHAGNWELMALSLARSGLPVCTIGKRSYDPRFTRLIDETRRLGPVQTLWRGEPDLALRMRETLAAGNILGLLIDQDTRVPGVFVPFFGRLAHTPIAAAALARETGAPLVTGFNFRAPPGGYQVIVEEHALSQNPDPRQAVADDTAALTARIERHVRAHPGEWVWMHRRWKTRPASDPAAPAPAA